MPKISRQVGSSSQILDIFIQDATVSTGAGLPNIVASSVSFSWWHTPGQAAASSGTASTAGAIGTFSTNALTQISSTLALGWYQFGSPDGLYASGDTAHMHFYGAPSMAPLPLEIELTKTNNQQYASSTNFSSVANANLATILGSAAVTTSAGILAYVFDLARTANPNSTVAFSSVSFSSVAVSVSGVNVTSIAGSPAVTTAAGILAYTFDLGRTANQNSTVAFSSVSFSSIAVSVSGVNVTSIAGSPPVTTAAGVLSTDLRTILGSAPVTTAAGVLAYTFDLARTANVNSTVAFSSVSFSTQSVSVGGVNVTSIAGSPPVTTAAGVIAVAWDLGRTANITSTVGATGLTISAGQTVTSVAGLNAALLDISVSSRAAPGAQMSLTTAERAALSAVMLTTTQPFDLRSSSAAGNIMQLQYEILQNLTNFTNSGTSRTLNNLVGAPTTATYQYDTSTAPGPNAITRIT